MVARVRKTRASHSHGYERNDISSVSCRVTKDNEWPIVYHLGPCPIFVPSVASIAQAT